MQKELRPLRQTIELAVRDVKHFAKQLQYSAMRFVSKHCKVPEKQRYDVW